MRRLVLLIAASTLSAFLIACDSTPQQPPAPPAAAQQPAEAVPDDIQAAARGTYGNEAVVLGYGTFFNTGSTQALVATRLAPGSLPGVPSTSAPPSQNPETSADVYHVSIIVRTADKWHEAFRADEHLKNEHGYLAGAPAVAVPAWHMVYEKTADDGFRLTLTPLGGAPGTKQTPVQVAWNPKRREYDSLSASGSHVAPRTTPGGDTVRAKPR